jgi:hypothetical protein
MMPLHILLLILMLLFAIIGSQRGWNKEIISTAGIILALFTLNSIDLRQTFNLPADRIFLVQTIIFSLIVFVAYQTRSLFHREVEAVERGGRGAQLYRSDVQNRIIGFLFGLFNGYLIWGSLWYFMHISDYPLSPFIRAPLAGSDSAVWVNSLPLVWLAGANGDFLLTLAVIVSFVIVLVLI